MLTLLSNFTNLRTFLVQSVTIVLLPLLILRTNPWSWSESYVTETRSSQVWTLFKIARGCILRTPPPPHPPPPPASPSLLMRAIVKQREAQSYPWKEGAMSKLFNGKSDVSTFYQQLIRRDHFSCCTKINNIQQGVLQLIICTFISSV